MSMGSNDYANDLVFAPDQTVEPGGYTHTQQKTVDHPWKHVPTEEEGVNSKPAPNSVPPPQERSINHSTATYERSPKRVLFSAISLWGTVNAGDIPGLGPVKLVDSQPGRKCVAIKCPPGNTKGAYIGHNIDAVLSGFSWLVSPGDPILYLFTEDAIWTMGIPGTVIADVIQVAVTFDPIEA